MFVDTLAYADDIMLIVPTSRAMRRMLSICDSFSDNFSIAFNAKKSTCLIFEHTRKAGSFKNQKPVFLTLEVMQLRLLTNGLILVTLLTIVLMMVLTFHLGVIQW